MPQTDAILKAVTTEVERRRPLFDVADGLRSLTLTMRFDHRTGRILGIDCEMATHREAGER